MLLIGQGSRAMRSTTQICVMTRHQYGISAVAISRGNQYAGVAKCRLFSQATQAGRFSLLTTNYIIFSLISYAITQETNLCIPIRAGLFAIG